MVLSKASRIDLADSALHAPGAGFGDQDFYPDLIDKAAVLTACLGGQSALRFPLATPKDCSQFSDGERT